MTVTLWQTGPAFNGYTPTEILNTKNSGVWATVQGSSGYLELWYSPNGKVFTINETLITDYVAHLACDASDRVWRVTYSYDTEIATISRYDNEVWVVITTIETVGLTFNDIAFRGIICHPTLPNTIVIGAFLIESNDYNIAVWISTNGTTFVETILESDSYSFGSSTEVLFSDDGSLIIAYAYAVDVDSVADYFWKVKRAVSPYTSFTQVLILNQSDIYNGGKVGLCKSSSAMYLAVPTHERTAAEYLSLVDLSLVDPEDFSNEQVGRDLRIYISIDDGITWSEITTPFHMSASLWGANFDYNTSTPGLFRGMTHDGSRLLVFFTPHTYYLGNNYNRSVSIVMGANFTGDGTSFSINGQVYTWNESLGDFTPDPVVTPPPGCTATFIGNNGGNGYRQWYSINSTPDVIVIDPRDGGVPTMTIVDIDFRQARTNNDNQAYNGRGVGAYKFWTGAGSVLTDVISTDVGEFDPSSVSLNRNVDLGATKLGVIWAFREGDWIDVSSEFNAVAGTVIPIGRPSI